jgi:hypothetical protein
VISPYPHVSAQTTEAHISRVMYQIMVHGWLVPYHRPPWPHPFIEPDGRADYGQPIPRVTWRRNLPPPPPLTCKVCKPPYKHASAQVRG